MPFTLEREIKLPFETAETARRAIAAIGAVRIRERRRQQDFLLDTDDGRLRRSEAVVRLRIEPDRAVLTFKGPVQPAAMKLRNEIETVLEDSAALLAIFEQAGLRVWFRYEKYREEFRSANVVIALDETPVGVFVELEGAEHGISAAAKALGRGPEEYLIDSYRSLFLKHCSNRGVPATHMLFEDA